MNRKPQIAAVDTWPNERLLALAQEMRLFARSWSDADTRKLFDDAAFAVEDRWREHVAIANRIEREKQNRRSTANRRAQ